LRFFYGWVLVVRYTCHATYAGLFGGFFLGFLFTGSRCINQIIDYILEITEEVPVGESTPSSTLGVIHLRLMVLIERSTGVYLHTWHDKPVKRTGKEKPKEKSVGMTRVPDDRDPAVEKLTKF
jgi:hypothetical protein